MGEINNENFKEKWSEIENTLKNAKFIAVDLEFSALYPLKNQSPSLFDTPSERYTKLKNNLEQVIPLQIGLTAFDYDCEWDAYSGTIFNFYVLPASFPSIDKSFLFQASSLNFLKENNFDFNKLVYKGIPFLNETQVKDLSKRLKDEIITEIQSTFKTEMEQIQDKQGELIKNWYPSAEIDEKLTLSGLYKELKGNYELLYFVQKNFRSRFKNLWTSIEDDELVVKKLGPQEFLNSSKQRNLEDELIDDLLGFTKVFRLLTNLKKPIIGHNLLQDLLLLYESFYEPLPKSYGHFKNAMHTLFPKIFDTRTISFELNSLIPEEKRFKDRGLSSAFEYFQNGFGRHVALNSPEIGAINDDSYGKFHEAGWDSFCAGYIFVRWAYLNIYFKYPKSKRFVSSELIGGLSEFMNKVNVIRGSISYVQMDGEDPISSRPPFLVVESIKKNSMNISQVTSILSSFGFVEVRKMPHHNRRALVAVDNFGNARRILKKFQSSNEFSVMQYSTLKHSPVVRAVLIGSCTISGALILWAANSIIVKR